MDPMQLAQMKRQVAWHTQEVKHQEMEYHTAELALEAAKKKVEDLKKKLVEGKHMLEMREREVTRVMDEEKRNKAKR
ncbi:hypothetical protein HZC00_04050 [Candidatus Kaiserbacteria bacterium]|nr:hypothetical protein [Candidatus Kaiserbacteria bacterium]